MYELLNKEWISGSIFEIWMVCVEYTIKNLKVLHMKGSMDLSFLILQLVIDIVALGLGGTHACSWPHNSFL